MLHSPVFDDANFAATGGGGHVFRLDYATTGADAAALCDGVDLDRHLHVL